MKSSPIAAEINMEEAGSVESGEKVNSSPSQQTSLSQDLIEVFKHFAPLGFLAFGGPTAHIALLHERFVEKHKWLDEEQFLELMAVGQGLPGPTSTQMVVSTGTFKGGILGGLLAFALWNLPSFVVLVLAGLGVRTFLDGDADPAWMSGLAPAASSLLFVACFTLGKKVTGGEPRTLKIALALTSALITVLLNGDNNIDPAASAWLFPLLLVLGGLAVLAHDALRRRREAAAPPAKAAAGEEAKGGEGEGAAGPAAGGITPAALRDTAYAKVNIPPWLAGALAAGWLAALVVVVGVRRGGGGEERRGLLALFEAFFRIGSIIYGGGQVVLPMLLNEVVDPGWVTEEQFFQGFALVQALPGPLFNFSAYLGCVYKGFPGAVVGWCGLFGPGIVLIFAFLPFWERVRKYLFTKGSLQSLHRIMAVQRLVKWFKTFLVGVNSTAIGLVVAACVVIWQKAAKSYADALVFLFTGALVAFFKAPAPAAIVAGGLLGWVLSGQAAALGQKDYCM